MKTRWIIPGFIIYGIAVGFGSVWWQQYTDSISPLNIPGEMLGDLIYQQAINYLGNPHSAQAHYTIPWVFRIPQVYVPTSIVFWGILGTGVAISLRCVRLALKIKTYL